MFHETSPIYGSFQSLEPPPGAHFEFQRCRTPAELDAVLGHHRIPGAMTFADLQIN